MNEIITKCVCLFNFMLKIRQKSTLIVQINVCLCCSQKVKCFGIVFFIHIKVIKFSRKDSIKIDG